MFTLQDNGDYAFTDAQRNVWGTIDVNVTIADTGEVIPFTVDPQDSEEYGQALWDQINARPSASSGTASRCAAGCRTG